MNSARLPSKDLSLTRDRDVGRCWQLRGRNNGECCYTTLHLSRGVFLHIAPRFGLIDLIIVAL